MSEIERAIQELEDNAYHPSLKPEVSEASKAVALRVLRAELEREKNPLTCDGCKREAVKREMGAWGDCVGCCRGNELDDNYIPRYEPKGEKA